MDSILTDVRDRLRLRVGLKLLEWALAWLPEWSWQLQAIARDLHEQREYERYVGWTQLMRGAVLPFETWRPEWRWRTRKRELLRMPQRQDSNAQSVWGAA